MKILSNITVLIMLFMIIVMAGCKKENAPADTTGTDALIETMAGQALVEMENKEVYAGNAETAIYMDDDGISPAFLANESDLTGKDGTRQNIRKHSFIKCLRGLSLYGTQAVEVKTALRTYAACNDKAVKRAKAIYRELQAVYKQKYNRIYQAFVSGTITEREFKKQVEALRIAFKRELRSLHLKDKLDEAFAKCLRGFFGELKSVLTEKQWHAFTECYRKP